MRLDGGGVGRSREGDAGHRVRLFRQPMAMGVWAKGGKTEDYSAGELSRHLAEKLRLTTG